MKVFCIDDTTLRGKRIKGLTVGKKYDVLNKDNHTMLIIDDNGNKVWFDDAIFMTLEKWRELQLKDLLIHSQMKFSKIIVR